MTPTPHGQVPEALRLAQELDAVPETGADPQTIQEAAAELRRLHAYCQELESQVVLDCMTHVQNPAENEHVAGDVSKNGAELNMTGSAMRASHGQASQQEPSYTSAQLAEMVLSDCGHSSNYTPLLNRVAARIDAHVERCLESKKMPQQEAQEPHGWLYEWTHSSATGKPDSTHTAFTTNEAHARKHDNCRAIYTAPQPAPATQPAPQQEAQEPTAVVVPCHTPSGKRVALYSAKQDLPIGTQLYTAPQPSPAAQGDALSDDAVRVPLDSLHADAAYLIGRLREGSMPYARVIEIIRERIDAAMNKGGA